MVVSVPPPVSLARVTGGDRLFQAGLVIIARV
jgi:hypothetical protein